MEVKWRNIIAGLFTVAVLTACGGGNDDNSGAGAPAPTPTPTAEEWLLFAEDGSTNSNNLSVFKATASSPIQVPIPKLGQTITLNTLPLGEIHFANGKAYIVVTSGLTGPAPGNLPSGGLVVIDLAHPDTVETILVLASTSTVRASRIVHLYIEPDGKVAWANNDGASGDNNADSVFRINVDPTDTDASDPDGKYLDYRDIQVGNGHHKLAIGRPSATRPTVRKAIYISSLTENVVHVIDNDTASGTFGKVIKTIRNVGNSPHGMDYAPNSGRAFSGVTNGGLLSIDGTLLDAANIANFPDVDCTPGGTPPAAPGGQPYTGGTPIVDAFCVGSPGTPGAGQEDPSVFKLTTGIDTNPALFTGYLKVLSNDHDEDTIYATGRNGSISKGWVTVINPGSGATPPSAETAIDLGDGGGNSIAHGGEHHGGKIYVPSNSGTLNDEVVVIDADHHNATVNTIVKRIEVGGPPGNLRYSGDGRLVMVPVTNGNTVKVIDTETDEVIDTLTLTSGTTAGNVGLVHLPFDAEDNR